MAISKQKLKRFQTALLKWFAVNSRYFPWRIESASNYQKIISEVLLQRTKAETIAKFYPIFLKKYPNWKRIDSEEQENLAEFLEPIGLYMQRSERLKKLAHEMALKNCRLPRKREELKKLPFFGQYIVNAILLLIYNERAPLLDVNMARVLERNFGKRKLSDIRNDPYLQKLAYDFADHCDSKELNWAIIDFSALVCKPKPKCNICPINIDCKYFLSYSAK
jgi:A/G-specific adenine glycosylase